MNQTHLCANYYEKPIKTIRKRLKVQHCLQVLCYGTISDKG